MVSLFLSWRYSLYDQELNNPPVSNYTEPGPPFRNLIKNQETPAFVGAGIFSILKRVSYLIATHVLSGTRNSLFRFDRRFNQFHSQFW